MIESSEFERLIDQNKGPVYKVIRLYVDLDEDVADLYQEVLIQAWKSFGSFKGASKFSTWLYRVALNTVLTYRCKEDRRTETRPIDEGTHRAVEAENSEQKELLWHAIRELDELDRAVVTLHFDGYDYGEISAITGLSASNVRVRLHRIKKRITKKLRLWLKN
ncbi:MAG: sigma-70 family RNA polymerase sigma factor [Flavobacteriales bacterium]|nr:sigma-70 family RNA polymerase sigma factor [Flavobacteriales bacterium]